MMAWSVESVPGYIVLVCIMCATVYPTMALHEGAKVVMKRSVIYTHSRLTHTAYT